MKIISRPEAKARGLRRYFTGKSCCHGHIAERCTSSRKCRACETPEKHKARNARYLANDDNRLRSNECSNKWKQKNLERCREYKRQYELKHRKMIYEKANERQRKARTALRALQGLGLI